MSNGTIEAIEQRHRILETDSTRHHGQERQYEYQQTTHNNRSNFGCNKINKLFPVFQIVTHFTLKPPTSHN
jgi:hypothetical protein